MALQSKPSNPLLHRFAAPVLLLVLVLLISCSRMFSWSPGSVSALGPVVQQQQHVSAGAAAAIVPAAGVRMLVAAPPYTAAAAVAQMAMPAVAGSALEEAAVLMGYNSNSSNSSRNSTTQHHHHQQPKNKNQSEWDTHIIFNGNFKGRLDECVTTTTSSSNSNSNSSNSSSSSSSWAPGTWLGHSGSWQQGGYMLPHSALVQQQIWQHQHPSDCSKAKFLLYRNPRLGEGSHGVGSLLHLQTTMLLLALNSGRVLAEIPGTYLTDHPYCGNRSTIDTCYFQPLTHCKVSAQQIMSAYKLNGTAGSSDQAAFMQGDPEGIDKLGQYLSADKLFPQKSRVSQTVPKAFQHLLQNSGIPSKNLYYWWRSQAVAYIVRPNAQALNEVAVRKRDKLRGLPLAPGCVSLYIRHGDKHTEHKTYNDSEYEQALNQLRRVDPSLTRQVFLSTEDPATVTYYTNATRRWSTSYVEMPRKPDRKKNNLVYMREHGFAEEMLDGLLNLDLALQCDGFVSSINSNWARLIDELRSTVRCRAHAKYMDVGLRSPKGVFFWY